MAIKRRPRSARRQWQLRKRLERVARRVDSMSFFNLITGTELVGSLEALLPEHRERRYPPTVTLAMFLGQVLSADGSCQNAVNEAIVNQLVRGVELGSANTGSYSDARKRLPLELVRTWARRIAQMMGRRAPAPWMWRGREVKMVDGTTILMPDTAHNQARYPQHGNQKSGAGFPIARLVGVLSLAHGARCSTWRWGRTKAKELGSTRCFASCCSVLRGATSWWPTATTRATFWSPS